VGRALAAVAVAGLGIAVGAFTLAVARDDSSAWFAGSSAAASIAFLAAGWALVGFGLTYWLWRAGDRVGLLFVAAGFGWFLLEWNSAEVGSSLAFTIGLCFYLVCAPLLAHAALAYPRGRLSSNVERGTLAVAYAGSVLVLGVLPALFFDPRAQGCTRCPRNLVGATDSAEAVGDLNRIGVWLGVGWAVALVVLIAVKLARASIAARRSAGPVLAAGAVYLALIAAWFAASIDRGLVTNGILERRLWLGQAAALLAVTLGIAWNWIRGRRARDAVARLVVELAESPPPGRLRDSLATIVGDPELVLAYPVGESRLVDAEGRAVELSPALVRTNVVRDGRCVAVLGHAPGLLDEQLVDEVAAAARLALENERLQAEVLARLEELRASRARIVETGDAERQRLERDLHDGAQQRLVGLLLSVRLVRTQVESEPSLKRLDDADAELGEAIAELRDLAHGIFPAALAEEGLAAAVEALAEEARVPMRIEALAEGRFPASIEAAAYTVVAEATRGAASTVAVRVERRGEMLEVVVETDVPDHPLALIELEDRVGAVDGRLAVDCSNGHVTIRAELPCGS